VWAGSGEVTMAPTDKKRLLLLCGTSLLTLQLVAAPIELSGPAGGFVAKAARAQEASCFVAGTLVLMADGSERPIETLRPGDAVLGRRGRVNRVVGSERTPLGRRRLYAFNGRRPFVTAEHPFLTSEGWKALDPEATRRENDRLHVAALQVGDRICRGIVRRVGGEGGPAESGRELLFLQSATVLEALAAVEGDPRMLLFNLLLDGDHSYVADGWIVHNKEGDAGGGAAGGSDGRGAAGDGSAGGGSDGGGSDGGGSDGGGSDGDSSDGGGSDGGGSDGGGSDGGSSDGAGSSHGGGSSDAAGSSPDGDAADAGPQGVGAANEGGSSATGSAPDGDREASSSLGGSDPAQSSKAAPRGVAGATQPATRKAANERAQASPPSARTVLDAFLERLGFRDPSDAGLDPTGTPLSPEQERQAIKHRWRERD
jgi:Hom_end-associated Hint